MSVRIGRWKSYVLPVLFIQTVGLWAKSPTLIVSNLERLKLSVVSIHAFRTLNQKVVSRVGTGFVYREDGYIVTTQNVVQFADSIQVTLANGHTERAWIVPNDKRSPIAMIKISGAYLPAKRSELPKMNNSSLYYILGNSLGIFPSLSLSELNTTLDTGVLELSVTAFAGNSGAPLLNQDGDVVGMFVGVYGTHSPDALQKKGLALPMSKVREEADYILARIKEVQCWMGISAVDVDDGVEVVGIVSSGPAEEAALSPGDTIVAFDGNKVENVQSLGKQMQHVEPNQMVELEIKRGEVLKKMIRIGVVPWMNRP